MALHVDGQPVGDDYEIRLPGGDWSVLPGCHLRLEFRSDTEHREEDPAFVGVGRIGRDDSPGLAGGAVGQGLDVTNLGRVSFCRHESTVGDVSPDG